MNRRSRAGLGRPAVLVSYIVLTACAQGAGMGDGAVARTEEAIQGGWNDTTSVLNDAVAAVSVSAVDPATGLQWTANCSGTLITATWILTAAHCVAKRYNAPGEANSIATFGVSGGHPYQITGCVMHPLAFDYGHTSDPSNPQTCGTASYAYDCTTCGVDNPQYDVALVNLAGPVPRALARPMRVLLQNPLPTYPSWDGTEVWMRGFGEAGAYGAAHYQPATRQVGDNTLSDYDAVTPPMWNADESTGSLPMDGDSGGPLIWYPGGSSALPTIIGVTSHGTVGLGGSLHASWANTTLPETAAWINSVMSDGDPQATYGSTTPPPTGWDGEGADAVDDCPGRFNPWQTDSVGNGVGDDCRAVAPASSAWGAAWVDDSGAAPSYDSAGAPVVATHPAPGAYTVSMKSLGVQNAGNGGNVQVVATGTSPRRCKVVDWVPIGNDMTIDVACYDATGAPASAAFVVLLDFGAAPQIGGYLWYGGSSAPAGYSWNSAGGSNQVTHYSTGTYGASLPGLGSNASVHVTAYGGGTGYCNVASWGAGVVNVQCYAQGGALADSAFSLMVSDSATRSGMVGGHAWVSGATSAPWGYQETTVAPGWCGEPAATVASYQSVTYPQTVAIAPGAYWYPLTTAYGYGFSGYCSVAGVAAAANGTDAVVTTQCFDASGRAAGGVDFAQSFVSNVFPAPC